MARRTPAAVVYRIGRFLHLFGKMVVRLNSVTLPNLMAGRNVFPEFVSSGSREPAIEFLTESIDAMLGDQYYFRQTLQQLDDLRERYARGGASAKAAKWICQQCSDGATELPAPIRRAA
jgi:lipid-A-disaccharide synthase